MNSVPFHTLKLRKPTLEAISKKGFKVASEIQAKVIPLVLEGKHDVIGIAQTGTGKTGAFGLPLIDLINKTKHFPQAIILTPTRELALQVSSELKLFSGKQRRSILTIYGGSSINKQILTLKRGVDIVVGTPGRVVDLINRGQLKLKHCRYFILDEADEMLKMGFIEDVEFVLEQAAKERRVYLFSATMPERIKKLSKKYMHSQKIVEVKKKQEINTLIEQSYYRITYYKKPNMLKEIIRNEDFFYGIVFCKTKKDVDMLTKQLKEKKLAVDCIHGDIPQSKRERILKKFRDQKITILVATDVAARGIDIDSLSHVINYTLPEDGQTYTHRIGRTGRAGKKGKAISLVSQNEMKKLFEIQKELKIKIKLEK